MLIVQTSYAVSRSVTHRLNTVTLVRMHRALTRDVSGAEQLAISLRWGDESYEIYEDLTGLVEVHATDAATI